MTRRPNCTTEGRGESLGSAVEVLGEELGRLVAGFEPEVVTAGEAAELVGRFAEIERLAAAGRLLAAGRMASTSVWAGDGDTDVASWLARTTGQSKADAKKDLAAARALDELDDTRDALRRGRLTKEQVREVAPAAAVAPGQEGDLLAEAATGSVERLADKARAAKAAARREGRDALARMRRRRALTHGRADDGSAWLRASGPPDDIARILAGLVPWAEGARRAARDAGEVLTEDQARFDGLVALAAQPVPASGEVGVAPGVDAWAETGRVVDDGSVLAAGVDAWADIDHDVDGTAPEDGVGGGAARGTPPPGVAAGEPRRRRSDRGERRGRPRWAAKVIVNVDLPALRRGFVLPGERCEITGVGPVPVAVVDELLRREDTFVAAVVRDGVDIHKVAHLGRAPTAAQRTALEADHTTCCIDGCPLPPKVIDHHHRYADDGPRTLANLGPLCGDHDARKTSQGWVLVRHGRSRRLVPPGHPLAAGAVRGGCVDLDEPTASDLPPPNGSPHAGPTRARPRPGEQLDLLAG
ncbi:MAG: HNH endonuclease signature motif containing protein [Acidimicrobiales bacterium]